MRRLSGTLHEDQYTFLIISRSVTFNMRNVCYKISRKNQNPHFMFNNFSFSEKRAANETMWKYAANQAGHR